MGERTRIEWADHSWSPWRGCTKVSPGCAHCYAETLAKRNPTVLGEWGRGRPRVLAKNWNDPVRWNKRAAPLRLENAVGESFTVSARRPRVFPSLCDWLDDEVPIEWLARFLTLIHETPHLDWLLLTKRPENFGTRANRASAYLFRDPVGEALAAEWVESWLDGNAPANVWFGVSVEDQERAEERIPQLLQIPARCRWLSLEPLLGPVELAYPCFNGADSFGSLEGLHWLVIGGESGPKARPCAIEWVQSLVNQGREASLPVFVKQLGSNPVVVDRRCGDYRQFTINDQKGGDEYEWPAELRVRQWPILPNPSL